MNQIVEVIKYSSYTEAQKRAIQKYRSKNKEQLNFKNKEYSLKYYKKKSEDPEFREKEKARLKTYYYKKKNSENI
jgi:hypothetical protein